MVAPSKEAQGNYNWLHRNATFPEDKWRYYELKLVIRSPEELGFSSKHLLTMCKRLAHYINRYLREGKNEYGCTPLVFSAKEVPKPDTGETS